VTIPTPDFQADVNTRGRTDDTFYDHVNDAVMSATGSPTVAGSGNDQYLTFNGSSQYVQTSMPASLSATFADSQYTISARVKSTGAIAAYSHIFGFNNATDSRRVNILFDNTAGYALAGFDTPSGTDVFLNSTTQIDDTNFHVVTMRADGTDLSLWVDGTEVDTDTTTRGTMGTLNELCIARRGGTGDNWHLAGSVQWVAVWESALTDAQIGELDDLSNPFALTISVDDSTIDPHPDTVVTITKSAVWNGTVSATIEGSTITLTDIDTTHKSFTLDIDDLLPGGDWNAIRPVTDATLAVTDSDGTFTTEVQIVFSPSVAEDYVNSPGVNVGTYLAVPGAVTGDPHFAFWHIGGGVRDKTISGTTDAGTGYFAPITLPSQGRLIAYDVSAGAWLAAVDTELFQQPASAEGGKKGYTLSIKISISL